MSETGARTRPTARDAPRADKPRPPPPEAERSVLRPRAVPLMVTLIVAALAAVLAWAAWQAYMAAPWTRDAAVQAYVVTVAPQVSGEIIELPVKDNQLVRKGELLGLIDPTDYEIALAQAEAAAAQARANAKNAEIEARRREQLNNVVVSAEEKERYLTSAQTAEAALQGALANVERARVNLQRTRILSPVNGYVTHLLMQPGDYVTTGKTIVSVVDSDSFWVDAYFEETNLGDIHPGDPATIKLMGYKQILHGHVQGIARGIAVANAEAAPSGLAQVNPIFTWVRLAQRIPVRIQIDRVPPGVELVIGETASVQVMPRR